MPQLHELHPWMRPVSDHAFQQTLDLLDADLRLFWNDRLRRFEVWKRELEQRGDVAGVFYDFILRVEDDDGSYLEPGSWLLRRLRERDARHAGAKHAARTAIADMDARNAALERDRRARRREEIAAIAHEYAPIFGRELAGDPTFMKPFAVPENLYGPAKPAPPKAPLEVKVKESSGRAAIRQAAAS